LNLHCLAATRPSTWRVCQFRHSGAVSVCILYVKRPWQNKTLVSGNTQLASTTTNVPVVPEADIRRPIPGNLFRVCWRQWLAERTLARRGLHFRSNDPDLVTAAYAAMTAEEFDAVNGRQDWANWRTIPRCLNRHVPNHPLRIIDLGCGTGGSTQVLAWHAPTGSHLSGHELAEPLLAVACRRRYLDRMGQPVRVDFVGQGLMEPLREKDGGVVADEIADVVNASGVLGHHFSPQTIGPLIAELRRVLRPSGIAMLDVGPTLPERELTRMMNAAGFRKLGHWRSWPLDPTGQVVYHRLLPLPLGERVG
jgi:SAM-dependent methyltransferase